ncbi:MAG TPA: cytochrome c oxidase subunit 3 family protein [Bacteroidales bacterium]|nr:cytochrome c oxidase subunit 3 family protein [Bacteroidales bacterium]
MEQTHAITHRDDHASRIGMWLFVFTELFLFAGLFLVFAVFRIKYAEGFHLASEELNITLGTINSIILLLSGMTMGIAYSTIQKGENRKTVYLLVTSLLLGITFLIIKAFEWKAKLAHGLYPGSQELINLSQGDIMFFGLYFIMTGLHALHLFAGLVFISVVIWGINKGRVRSTKFALLENCSLYWHMVDLVWIFLFPLFYLIN